MYNNSFFYKMSSKKIFDDLYNAQIELQQIIDQSMPTQVDINRNNFSVICQHEEFCIELKLKHNDLLIYNCIINIGKWENQNVTLSMICDSDEIKLKSDTKRAMIIRVIQILLSACFLKLLREKFLACNNYNNILISNILPNNTFLVKINEINEIIMNFNVTVIMPSDRLMYSSIMILNGQKSVYVYNTINDAVEDAYIFFTTLSQQN